jgi:cyclopropane fatty-acyl-phospholipid synthase-like methyltransferase
MIKKLLLCTLLLLPVFGSESYYVSSHGYFIGDAEHVTDWKLAKGILDFLEKEGAHSVVDFGCADGDYVNYFIKGGLDAVGYDGNPVTELSSGGTCFVKDLTIPLDLKRKFDWVMSLETGEHLPQEFEMTFIRTLMRHAKKGIILSWAIKGQGGVGHFNEQNNDYIKKIFADLGWLNDVDAENKLKENLMALWFAHSLMVFRRT